MWEKLEINKEGEIHQNLFIQQIFLVQPWPHQALLMLQVS